MKAFVKKLRLYPENFGLVLNSTNHSLKSWQQTGKKKESQILPCNSLIIKWVQLGSNLDLPLIIGPKKSGYLSYLQHLQLFMYLHQYN